MALKSLRDAEATFAEMARGMLAIREESQAKLDQLQQTLLAAINGKSASPSSTTIPNATGVNGHAKKPAAKPESPLSAAAVKRAQLLAELANLEAAGNEQPVELVGSTESEPHDSVVEILDDADRASPITQAADRGASRDIPSGSFRLRKSSASGSGSIVWPENPGRKGIAATPLADSTTRKVTVRIKERQKDGKVVEKDVEKTLNLHDSTRNIVGPLLQDQYYTVDDHVDDNARLGTTGRKAVKFVQVDNEGRVIPKTECMFRLSTAESGSLMLSGEMSAKMFVKDDAGESAVVTFTPVARGMLYLMGKDYMRIDKKQA